MKNRYGKLILILLCVILAGSMAVYLAQAGKKQKQEQDLNQSQNQDQDLTLEVALFPYVPDPVRFQTAVSDAWYREHPDVDLHFADWDCYVSDPDPSLDVFVFDSVYLASFVADGYLLPVPEDKIRDKEDIIPFALDGCSRRGKYYALPQLLCADFLYTRKGDAGLVDVSDVVKLYEILGDRKTQSLIPEENEGLLINLSDTLLTKTMMYLDSLMDEEQQYNEYDSLPRTDKLSAAAIERMRSVWKMGGEEQVSYWPEDNDPYIRARWFADGKGRAYIGYSEAMAAMGDYAENVDMRLFSYGSGGNIRLFYTDMVGISSKLKGNKKDLAIDLANLLISEPVLSEMSRPSEAGDPPQYLLTARRSVYDMLGRDYPIYLHLKSIADNGENHVFRMGPNARQYIGDMENALSGQLARNGEEDK